MSNLVLDSSAVIAFVQEERGFERFEAAVEGADASWVSAVNLTEVLTKLIDGGVRLEDAERSLAVVDASIVEFDAGLARDAAGLRGRRDRWAFRGRPGLPRACHPPVRWRADNRARPGRG